MRLKNELVKALNKELNLQQEFELWDGEPRLDYSQGVVDTLNWVLGKTIQPCQYDNSGISEEGESWEEFMNRKLRKAKERMEREMSHMQEKDVKK